MLANNILKAIILVNLNTMVLLFIVFVADVIATAAAAPNIPLNLTTPRNPTALKKKTALEILQYAW